MRRFIYFLLAATMVMTIESCSKDDDMPDDDVIWDIAPDGVFIKIVDEEGNNLLDPKFDGASSRTLNLAFGISAINTVYEFEYSHRFIWENKEPHFDDHILYNGKKIEGNTLTLVLPKRQ